MNIECAKRIPLTDILKKLGFEPIRQENNILFYLSPLHKDDTAFLKIFVPKNIWFDEKLSRGGDVLAFVCNYLESQGENFTLADALRYLSIMMGYAPKIEPVGAEDPQVRRSLYIDGIEPIQHSRLIAYLDRRGIPLKVAERYLKEVRVCDRDTKKSFLALGLRNEDGGYEVWNAFTNEYVGKRNITFIRGTVPKPNGIHIFKNGFDFMSAVMRQEGGKPFKEDTLIAPPAILTMATPYLYKYGYEAAFTWMDNSVIGRAAALSLNNYFKTEDGLTHSPMNYLYKSFQSVNDWHIQAPKAGKHA
ncbi:hypothetical protein F0L74_16615 [Chitinophaga agrisoli]|uniref:Toprim domain-containing protein n=1 Tax=Chitinophaga agrisoli TaxID=2607653 RepID=A0A5B2VSA6_9BACT|nr:hypothetical protein [Chitinophaga agrisoli]KAA2241518.1 hypothetical protein F0L74_16615 [Chitinophaga agrisoli]